jgi:hypothetical protein
MMDVKALTAQAELAAKAVPLTKSSEGYDAAVTRATDLYEKAQSAASMLGPADPIRLECALRYATFLYRKSSRRDAYAVAEEAAGVAERAGAGDVWSESGMLVATLRGRLASWRADRCQTTDDTWHLDHESFSLADGAGPR